MQIFKSLMLTSLLKNKAKLLGNTVKGGANGILRNATIAVLLKYLGNFWISLEMPLINWKLELKLKSRKHWILSAAANDNDNDSGENIIFNIKDTKSHVPVVTLSGKNNQKLSKLLSKGFERSVYWNKYKTNRIKMKIKIE